MPFGAILGAVAGPLIGGILGGGGSSAGQTPAGVNPATQMPNQAAAANTLYGDLGQYGNIAQQYYGMQPSYANQAFNAMYANPYATQMQTAAGQAGQTAGQLAPLGVNAATGLYDAATLAQMQGQQGISAGQGQYQAAQQAIPAGQQAFAAGQQTYQTALDPQQALYNRTAQQLTDQIRAGESARGLATSPVGQQMETQGLSNFNIDWQNQQLARQLQGQQALQSGAQSLYGGLGAAGQGVQSLYGGIGTAQAGTGVYGQAAGQGANLGQAAVNQQLLSGQLPYQTAQGIAQGQFGAIGANQAAMAGALTPYQQQIQNLESYLGLGQSNQAQAAIQAARQQQLQQQNVGNMANLGFQIGQNPNVQSAVGRIFGGNAPSSGGSSSPFYTDPTTYTGWAA